MTRLTPRVQAVMDSQPPDQAPALGACICSAEPALEPLGEAVLLLGTNHAVSHAMCPPPLRTSRGAIALSAVPPRVCSSPSSIQAVAGAAGSGFPEAGLAGHGPSPRSRIQALQEQRQTGQ